MIRLRQPILLFLSLAAVTTSACGGGEGGGTPPPPPPPIGNAGTGGSRPPAGTTGGNTGTAGSGGSTAGSGGSGGSTTRPPDAGNPGDAAVSVPLPVTPDGDYGWLTRPMPVLWITINGATIVAPGKTKAERTVGRIKIIQEHDGSPLTSVDGKPVVLDSPILIEGRGSSSFTAGAKFMGPQGYNVEFHDGNRNGVGQVMLGMPQNADWALVTCVSDKTCLRNALTYAIARDMAMAAGRWAPRFRWAEVYIDGAYFGVYLVAEKPKDDKNRVDLPNVPDQAAPNEHPYLINADGDCRAAYGFDKVDPKSEFLDSRAVMSAPPMGMSCEPMFRVPGNRRWKIRSPNADTKLTDAQRMYLPQAFDRMTKTLDDATGDWKAAIDLPSFLDYFVISEFSNNVDSFFKSWYMYKLPDSAGGKWFMGPVWDFDLAYGNANYYFRQCATNTQIGPLVRPTPPMAAKDDAPPPWALAPLKDTAVRNDLRCRWNSLRTNGPLTLARIEQRIDSFVTHMAAANARHQAKWNTVGRYIWPNNYVGATYADEIRYLKFWIRTRLAWVDRTLPGTCAAPANAPAVQQMPAPATVMVSRAIEMWGGESLDRFNDYVNILGTMPAEWACPPR
jgi:hypothetical protein